MGKVRILELVTANKNEPLHSFLVSLGDNLVWYSYVESIWSYDGDREKRYFKRIDKLIDKY